MSKSETDYKLGEPVQGVPVQTSHEKQGHKCCGGCCDMRRAVIIVNIINAFVLILGIASFFGTRALANNASEIYDDDGVIAAFEGFSSLPLGAFLAIQVTRIVCSLAGIVGGMKYNVILTGVAALMYCVDAVMSLVVFNIGGLVYSLFFAYPHFFFIKEVRAGIMSEENYPNEKMSCCCV